MVLLKFIDLDNTAVLNLLLSIEQNDDSVIFCARTKSQSTVYSDHLMTLSVL